MRRTVTVRLHPHMTRAEVNEQLETIAGLLDDMAQQAGTWKREQAILQAAADLYDVLAERE